MSSAAVITGVLVPTLTAWLSDQLPRKGLPLEENERRLRNIVLSTLVGFGVAYITMQLKGEVKQQVVEKYEGCIVA